MSRQYARGGAAGRLAVALAAVGALTAGIGVWAAVAEGDDRCAADARLVAPCGAWWGAYIPYDAHSSLTRPVHAFEKKIGRRLDLVYTYHDMSGNELDGTLLTPDERALGRDRMLMLAWESTVWKEPHHAGYTETQLGWKNIASGQYDEAILDPQIRRIKDYGKRVFLSFDQEADARIKEGAGTPAEYVAAYRHLHDRFQRLGADNVVWVWTVSGYLGSADTMKRLYPGDAYVDWIGMDQYNYHLCHGTTKWLDFDRSQRPGHDWLRENISADKPVMLAEFSTAPDPERPERQRDWYAAVPGVAPTLPKVKAYVHWNRAVPGPGCDLTVDQGPALEGYRIAGQDPYFNQPVPRR
ncbi:MULTISPECIES: glycoside hydrolase family 26 protein [unclassified Streptomyces]|uniref:glycoside hydrolase family 26 protein n=1 Tax=unclassified Streptomyces TaxID=2593676 RepID=UPI00367FAB0D